MIYFLMFKCHAFGFLVLPSKFCLQTLKLYPSWFAFVYFFHEDTYSILVEKDSKFEYLTTKCVDIDFNDFAVKK
jgi:hypothetical protein